jgi:hypothetical protein
MILPQLFLDLLQFVSQNLRLAEKAVPFAEKAIREVAKLVRMPRK